jgi:hypothetical protein
MNRLVRSLALSAIVATASLAAAVGAQADPGGNVGVCHGTGSAKNPLVMISVSSNSVPGHMAGGKERKADDALVIPATGTCDAGQTDGGNF